MVFIQNQNSIEGSSFNVLQLFLSDMLLLSALDIINVR